MSSGFIKLPRSLLQDPLWKSLPYTYRHIFLTILEHAVWKPTKVNDHGKIIDLKPGQLLTTLRLLVKLCDEPDINKRLIERALVKFNLLDFSGHEVGQKKTVITITRKDIVELWGTENGTKVGQTRDIKEEVKTLSSVKSCSNDRYKKNTLKHINARERADSLRSPVFVKNSSSLSQKKQYRDFVHLTEEEHQKLVGSHGEPVTNEILDFLNNYKASNGKRYKSDYHAILNWVIDAIISKKQVFRSSKIVPIDRSTKDMQGNPIKSRAEELF
jgi:hypothetical protein